MYDIMEKLRNKTILYFILSIFLISSIAITNVNATEIDGEYIISGSVETDSDIFDNEDGKIENLAGRTISILPVVLPLCKCISFNPMVPLAWTQNSNCIMISIFQELVHHNKHNLL